MPRCSAVSSLRLSVLSTPLFLLRFRFSAFRFRSLLRSSCSARSLRRPRFSRSARRKCSGGVVCVRPSLVFRFFVCWVSSGFCLVASPVSFPVVSFRLSWRSSVLGGFEGMRWFPVGLALSSYSLRRRFAAFLVSLVVSFLSLSFPLEADASVGWTVALADSLGLDPETFGLASVAVAVAAGTYYFYQSGAAGQVGSWMGSLWDDAASWATSSSQSSLASSFPSSLSSTNPTGVVLSAALASGIASFVQSEGSSLGVYASSGFSEGTSFSSSSLLSMVQQYDSQWAPNLTSHPYVLFEWMGGSFAGSDGSDTPSLSSWDNWRIIASDHPIRDAGGGVYYSSGTLYVHGENSSGSDFTTTPSSYPLNWAYEGDGVTYYQGVTFSGLGSAGTTVQVPPFVQDSSGGVTAPTAVPLSTGSTSTGWTTDGTTALDTSSGASDVISDTASAAQLSTAANTGTLVGDLANWFDLSKPIDWSPLEDLPWTKTFPFSLPWDLSNAISALVQSPLAPSFDVALPTLGGSLVQYSVTMPSFVSDLIPYVRGAEMVLLNIGLIYGIRSLLGGDV